MSKDFNPLNFIVEFTFAFGSDSATATGLSLIKIDFTIEEELHDDLESVITFKVTKYNPDFQMNG